MKKIANRFLSAMTLLTCVLGLPGLGLAFESHKVIAAETQWSRMKPELQAKIEVSPLLQDGPVRFVDPSGLMEVYLDKQKVSLQVDQELWDQMKDRYQSELGGAPEAQIPSSPQNMQEQGELVSGKGREILGEAGLYYDQILGELSADFSERLKSGTATIEDLRQGADRRFQADLIANPDRNLEAGSDGRSGATQGMPGTGGIKAGFMEQAGIGHDYGDNPANDGSSTANSDKNKQGGAVYVPIGKNDFARVAVSKNVGQENSNFEKGIKAEQSPLVGAKDSAPDMTDAILAGAGLANLGPFGMAPTIFTVVRAVLIAGIMDSDNPQADYVSAEERLTALVQAASENGSGGSPSVGSSVGLGIHSPGGKPGGPFEQSIVSGVYDSDVGGVGKSDRLEGADTEESAKGWKQFWKSPGGQNP